MKLELNIPESLDDITLEQYQRFIAIEEPTNDDLLSIFLDIDLNVLNSIQDDKIDSLILHINSLFEADKPHIMQFNLNGVRYGFIPNLDEISYGENKDVTTFINSWETMHKAMSVLFRPITFSRKEKYIIEEYKGNIDTAEDFKKMPLSVAFGANVFFYNLTNELLKAIPNYLEKEAAKEQTKGVISVENGEAIKKSLHLLKETLEDLTRLQDFHYTSV
mgnify:FL=1